MSDAHDFEDWLHTGLCAGYVGPPVCATHDGIPSSADEDNQFEQGFDPCLHIMRLYTDAAAKRDIESNHAPSVWRATNKQPKAGQ